MPKRRRPEPAKIDATSQQVLRQEESRCKPNQGMNKPRQIHCGWQVAVSTVGAAGVGVALKLIAIDFENHLYDLFAGKPLPILTQSLLSVLDAFPPAIWGVIFGTTVFFAGSSLLYSAPNEHRAKRYMVGFTIGVWLSIALLLGAVWGALWLPFLSVPAAKMEQVTAHFGPDLPG